GPVTSYFRTHFNFFGNPATARIKLRYAVDDGAVFYLNGAEFFRVRMPVGVITSSTLATAEPPIDPAIFEGPFDLALTNLKSGDNLVAVEVHQNAIASPDVVFGAELTASWPSVLLEPLPELRI